jgi:molecular chaperone HscB
MRFYEALGLEPKLALDPDDLRKRFYERSRESHPDLFGSGAEDRMAGLNDAFRTLRDPVARAEYFLKQKGLELSKQVPAELLDEVFELNMLLDIFRDGFRAGGEPARDQIEVAREMFVGMRDEIDKNLAELSRQYDTNRQFETLERIQGILSRRRYIANLVRDVDKELNVHSAN